LIVYIFSLLFIVSYFAGYRATLNRSWASFSHIIEAPCRGD